ncbi:uncharacterized protein LOC141907165 [Tubulanus polymorphus]|uniref:uncharacterized protein LOC141907165 n=1 Tax=Tubulanus polymorphus TaxID=672921 RepID=UPI003DA4F877
MFRLRGMKLVRFLIVLNVLVFIAISIISWRFDFLLNARSPAGPAVDRRVLYRRLNDQFAAVREPSSLTYNYFAQRYDKPESFKPQFRPELGPEPSEDFVVPNVMHYAWFHPTKLYFRFHHYMSVLSAYRINKPDTIYFWYHKLPEGLWWKRTIKDIPVIKTMYRDAPSQIFGREITAPEHGSDVVRLEAVLEYGGIYTDLDVIVLKSFDPLRRYDTSMGMEYEDGLGNGVIVAKPNATFVRIMYESYRDFNGSDWSWHSVRLPYRLATFYPELVHVEPTSINQPNCWSTGLIYDIGSRFDWSRNYCLHLWYRFYDKDHTPETVQTLDSTLGQVFRYIYYGNKSFI